jgi:hypothetical protein
VHLQGHGDDGLVRDVEEQDDKEGNMDNMVGMDMVYMEYMDNILDIDYMGAPRMGHTKGRTKCFPKDSMQTKNRNTMGYTNVYNLNLHRY